MDEGASQMIECPGSNCDILVDDQTVMKLVKEAKVKLKYQQLITNSFVQVRFSPFFFEEEGIHFSKEQYGHMLKQGGGTAPLSLRVLVWFPPPR